MALWPSDNFNSVWYTKIDIFDAQEIFSCFQNLDWVHYTKFSTYVNSISTNETNVKEKINALSPILHFWVLENAQYHNYQTLCED